MKQYPKFIEIKGEKLAINTSFRNGLKCDEIAKCNTIGDTEKALAIVYTLLGEKGLRMALNEPNVFDLCVKYLNCGKEPQDLNDDEEVSMDLEQDETYIKASFMSDYGIDLNDHDMHWYQFIELMNGLTDKCILNRVRSIREEPLNDKKGDQYDKWVKAKEAVALKVQKTPEQIELDKKWENMLRRE